MKLYATINSERGKPATKGSQERLQIEIERERVLVARVIVDDGRICLYPVERKAGPARARMDDDGVLRLES